MQVKTASPRAHPELSSSDDHTHDAVPLSERRDPVTMGLLWITMVTGFPTVLAGVQWFKDGLTLSQVLVCSVISCAMLLAYAIPANFLGAKSGQTYGLLSRRVFGNWGSRLITLNLNLVFIAWYGLASLLLADALKGLIPVSLPVTVLAVAIALLMAFNNFFGFTGVANFARFLAAPLLILWVAYTCTKALPTCPLTVLTEAPKQSFGFALTSVSSLVIGYAVWGNEPDYWRYGRPSLRASTLPVIVALLIGQIVFPATGWMVARMSGICEYAAATSFMMNYSFGGMALIAAVVLTVSYFAINDSNLYGATNAFENLVRMPHKQAVALLAVLGAVTAAWLSYSGAAKALESIASLNCIILPTPTVIMIAEWFILVPMMGRRRDIETVPDVAGLPPVGFAALVAALAGIVVGVATSGIIPGSEFMHVGVCSVQAWLTSLVVYVPLRAFELNREAAALRTLPRPATVPAEPALSWLAVNDDLRS